MRISDWSSDVCSSDLLKDVIERDPNYVIGISYPPNINQYPGLAAELQRYADAARSELMQAVDGLAGEKPSAPYDLSLAFNMLAETPQVVTVAANGSSYTGGAHGRSEEHTSELQSLMRLSYAVFCLHNNTPPHPPTQPHHP